MNKPTSPNPRGLFCPVCRGVRLHVTGIYRPCPGVVVRYRKCATCETRVKTEERAAKLAPPK